MISAALGRWVRNRARTPTASSPARPRLREPEPPPPRPPPPVPPRLPRPRPHTTSNRPRCRDHSPCRRPSTAVRRSAPPWLSAATTPHRRLTLMQDASAPRPTSASGISVRAMAPVFAAQAARRSLTPPRGPGLICRRRHATHCATVTATASRPAPARRRLFSTGRNPPPQPPPVRGCGRARQDRATSVWVHSRAPSRAPSAALLSGSRPTTCPAVGSARTLRCRTPASGGLLPESHPRPRALPVLKALPSGAPRPQGPALGRSPS